MLCLTRRTDEEIVVGDDIVIRVIQVRDGRVKLGFEAPRDVPIVRREVLERKNNRVENGSLGP